MNPLSDAMLARPSGSRAVTQTAPPRRTTGSTTAEQLEAILELLENHKATEVVVLDLRGRSELADHMVIASGRNARHLLALSQYLVMYLKKHRRRAPAVEGTETANWIILDADRILVHLFRPEVRDYYKLEDMWQAWALEPESRQ